MKTLVRNSMIKKNSLWHPLLLPLLTMGSIFFTNPVFAAPPKKEDPALTYLDPRGPAELVVCSQNLEKFGDFGDIPENIERITNPIVRDKISALIDRFELKKCDVIAVQEVFGKAEEQAKEALTHLSVLLKERTGRFFEVLVGTGTDPASRVGYLLAKDAVELLSSVSYSRIELPKLSEKQKPRFFPRAPFEIQIRTKRGEVDTKKTLTLINIHFKSKRGAEGDPALLEWETYRMEMAEAVRRIILNRHPQVVDSAKSLLMVLGDRNSNFDVASAKILEGGLSLRNFQENGGCRLTKRGAAICQTATEGPQLLFSVLTGDPQTKYLPGTFQYQKVYSWLDEILMTAPSLRFAQMYYDKPGDYDSGVVTTRGKTASDHAMVWVRLNW